MGQCNHVIQALRNPVLRHPMLVHRNDVCSPKLAELRDLLQAGGYALPAPYNGESDARTEEQLGRLETDDAIDDRMIMLVIEPQPAIGQK